MVLDVDEHSAVVDISIATLTNGCKEGGNHLPTLTAPLVPRNPIAWVQAFRGLEVDAGEICDWEHRGLGSAIWEFQTTFPTSRP
jgi:hypothetical protein